MNYSKFLKFLSAKEKILFSIGAASGKLVLSPIKYNGLRHYQNILSQIKRLGFEIEINNDVLLLIKDELKIHLRREGSDVLVFKQVFIDNEYQPLINLFIDNNISINTIIDAGSNVGLTTLKLLSFFPSAKIICLEPDPWNFEQLNKNVSIYPNAILRKEALWYQEEDLFLNFGFRDGQEWSRSVSTNGLDSQQKVRSITINKILEIHDLDKVDLLKIDIEGSEKEVFSEKSDLTFLESVKVIAIEIHDEFDCRNDIYSILKLRGYILFTSGELVIGINTKYLSK